MRALCKMIWPCTGAALLLLAHGCVVSPPRGGAPTSPAPPPAPAASEAPPPAPTAPPPPASPPKKKAGGPAARNLPAGRYLCQISSGYRFRRCTVMIDARGRHIFEVHPGSLLAFRGVLAVAGNVLSFNGRLTESRPFGCYACQRRCSIRPGTCFCKEIPPKGSRECLRQPIRFSLKRWGTWWKGMLTYRTYSNRYGRTAGGTRVVVGYSYYVKRFRILVKPYP